MRLQFWRQVGSTCLPWLRPQNIIVVDAFPLEVSVQLPAQNLAGLLASDESCWSRVNLQSCQRPKESPGCAPLYPLKCVHTLTGLLIHSEGMTTG